jgi:L-threonylcarbamoyladenylate synthase
MDLFWPGPLTILFPCSKNLSPLLTAGTGKIGLRWPKASLATALAKEAGTAVISTSANLSGQGGLISPASVLNDLEGRVDLVIDAGELPSSFGSTIVDATADHILVIREGEISNSTLQKFEINERGK